MSISSRKINRQFILSLLAVAIVFPACSTTRHTSENVNTLEQSETTLVKRSQTQQEIELLFARYEQAETSNMPRGLQAIMRQIVQVPTEDEMLQVSNSETTESINENSKSEEDYFVDESNKYVFARKKPALPLSGGFLNNPEKINVDPQPVARKTTSQPLFENNRGRLNRKEENSPIQKGINNARETTSEFVTSASEALASASEAIDRGFAALKQTIENKKIKEAAQEIDPTVDMAPSYSEPFESEQKTTEPKTKELKTKEEPKLPDPQQLRADVGEDISTAKNAFLARFNRESYSVIHEGILIVALVIGFFLVTWIRFEYEHVNKQ